jgi:hypothetical protein
MKFYSTTNKNEILSFLGKWMELEKIIVSEVSQAQKPKSLMLSLICSLLYALSYTRDRPRTNAAILCDMGHTKGRSSMGGKRQGKETKNLNVVNVLSVQE